MDFFYENSFIFPDLELIRFQVYDNYIGCITKNASILYTSYIYIYRFAFWFGNKYI